MKAALLSPVASPSRYCADHFAGRIIGGVARRRNRVWVSPNRVCRWTCGA